MEEISYDNKGKFFSTIINYTLNFLLWTNLFITSTNFNNMECNYFSLFPISKHMVNKNIRMK